MHCTIHAGPVRACLVQCTRIYNLVQVCTVQWKHVHCTVHAVQACTVLYSASVFNTVQACKVQSKHVQYNASIYSASMYSTLLACTVQCKHVQYSARINSTVQACTVHCKHVMYSVSMYTVQYCTVQFNSIQINFIFKNVLYSTSMYTVQYSKNMHSTAAWTDQHVDVHCSLLYIQLQNRKWLYLAH